MTMRLSIKRGCQVSVIQRLVRPRHRPAVCGDRREHDLVSTSGRPRYAMGKNLRHRRAFATRDGSAA